MAYTTIEQAKAGIKKPYYHFSKVQGVRNTFIVHYNDGSISHRLHQTDIITYYPDGSFTLNSDGHKTPLTLQRMNWLCPISTNIVQRKRKWYVHAWTNIYLYNDGMKIDRTGKLVIPTYIQTELF